MQLPDQFGSFEV